MVAPGREGGAQGAVDRLPGGEVLGHGLHPPFATVRVQIAPHGAPRHGERRGAFAAEEPDEPVLDNDPRAAGVHRPGVALVDLSVEPRPVQGEAGAQYRKNTRARSTRCSLVPDTQARTHGGQRRRQLSRRRPDISAHLTRPSSPLNSIPPGGDHRLVPCGWTEIHIRRCRDGECRRPTQTSLVLTWAVHISCSCPGRSREPRSASPASPPSVCPGSLRTRAGGAGYPTERRLRAAEQDRPDVAEGRRAWMEAAPRFDPAKMVFLDETWATTALNRPLSYLAEQTSDITVSSRSRAPRSAVKCAGTVHSRDSAPPVRRPAIRPAASPRRGTTAAHRDRASGGRGWR